MFNFDMLQAWIELNQDEAEKDFRSVWVQTEGGSLYWTCGSVDECVSWIDRLERTVAPPVDRPRVVIAPCCRLSGDGVCGLENMCEVDVRMHRVLEFSIAQAEDRPIDAENIAAELGMIRVGLGG